MSTINPVKTVKIDDTEVEFRELRAVEGIEFLKRLSSYVTSLKSGDDGETRGNLVSIVSGADDVAQYLVLRSARKEAKWLEEISVSGYVDALQAAIDLNLSEPVIKKALGVKASLIERLTSTPLNSRSPEASNS